METEYNDIDEFSQEENESQDQTEESETLESSDEIEVEDLESVEESESISETISISLDDVSLDQNLNDLGLISFSLLLIIFGVAFLCLNIKGVSE